MNPNIPEQITLPMRKIFISHSAKDPHALEMLDQLYDALVQIGYDVYLDKKRLELGSEWWDELFDELDVCHIGIILFSEDALQSDWVGTEAAILRHRQRTTDGFLLLPILLTPVQYDNLRNGRFAPLHLVDEIQCINEVVDGLVCSAEEIIQIAIASIEKSCWHLVKSPLGFLKLNIASFLGKRIGDHRLIEAIANRLGINLFQLGIHGEFVHRLVCQVVDGNWEFIQRAYIEIAECLDSDSSFELLLRIAPLWANRYAAAKLVSLYSLSDKPHKAFLNTPYPLACKMYIQRAYDFRQTLIIAEIHGRTGEDILGGLTKQIVATLKKELGIDDSEDVNECLEYWNQEQEPIFILVPGVNDQIIVDALCHMFPSINFLFLFTPPQEAQEQLIYGKNWLTPLIQDQSDRRFYFWYSGIVQRLQSRTQR